MFATVLLLPAPAFAGTAIVFSDRQAFALATGDFLTDDYENPGYQHVMSDAAMSGVFGQTQYFTYGGNVINYNNIMFGFGVEGSNAYCSLCYGSVRLVFDNTSLTTGGGVFGVGMDIIANSGAIPSFAYSARVTYADDTTGTFQLPYVPDVYPNPPVHQFWGFVADAQVRSLDLITHAASGAERTFFILDNLTIASAPVPEPGSVALAAAGLGPLLMARRKKHAA